MLAQPSTAVPPTPRTALASSRRTTMGASKRLTATIYSVCLRIKTLPSPPFAPIGTSYSNRTTAAPSGSVRASAGPAQEALAAGGADSGEQIEAHICAQCQLNPPDGSERLGYNDKWLHPTLPRGIHLCAYGRRGFGAN